MTALAIQVPQLLTPDSSEDPKVQQNFTNLQAWAGSLDLPAASGSWAGYTPAWTTSGTAPALGNGFLNGSYWLFGKTCMFRAQLTFGTTTTPGTGSWFLTLPFPAAGITSGTAWLFTAFAGGAGGVNVPATGFLLNGNTAQFIVLTANGNAINNANPGAWATGNNLQVQGQYMTT